MKENGEKRAVSGVTPVDAEGRNQTLYRAAQSAKGVVVFQAGVRYHCVGADPAAAFADFSAAGRGDQD